MFNANSTPISDLTGSAGHDGGETGKAILREIVETVALFAVIFTLARMTIGNYSIIGQSMEPNYHETQRLLVDRVSPRMGWLERGDIVIVRSPVQDEIELIKRLIGRPGDTIELLDNRVLVNGKALDEPYLNSGADSGPKNGISKWTLTENQYFIMGDNRTFSQDSRFFGPVDGARIAGRALLLYWPFGDFAAVRHHDYP
jgi:signal peptidase I